MSKKARRNYIRATSQLVNRKKMYKAKKQWIVAGMSFLVAIGIGASAQSLSAHADVTNTHVQSTAMAKQPQSSTSVIQNQASQLHNKILGNQPIHNNQVQSNVSNQVKQSASVNSVSASSVQPKGLSKLASNTPKSISSVSNTSNRLNSNQSNIVSSSSVKPQVKSISSVASNSIKPVSKSSSSNVISSATPKSIVNSSASSVDANSNQKKFTSAVRTKSVSSVGNQIQSQSSSMKQNQSVSSKSVNTANSSLKSQVGTAQMHSTVKHNIGVTRKPLIKDATDNDISNDIDSAINKMISGDTNAPVDPKSADPAKQRAVWHGKWGTANTTFYSKDNMMVVSDGTITCNHGLGFAAGVDNACGGFPQILSDAGSDGIKYVIFKHGVKAPQSLDWLFKDCGSLRYVDFRGLDTSHTTTMSQMLDSDANLDMYDTLRTTSNAYGHTDFDTSNVTNMSIMFKGGSSFGSDFKNRLATLPLLNWNVGKVTNFSGMFSNDSSLTNVDGVRGFSNPSDAEDMTNMFAGDGLTSAPHLTWTIGKNAFNQGKRVDLSSMFAGNPNLTDVSGLATLNTQYVISINNMFGGDHVTNWDEPLSHWNVENISDISDNGLIGIDRNKSSVFKNWGFKNIPNGCKAGNDDYYQFYTNSDPYSYGECGEANDSHDEGNDYLVKVPNGKAIFYNDIKWVGNPSVHEDMSDMIAPVPTLYYHPSDKLYHFDPEEDSYYWGTAPVTIDPKSDVLTVHKGTIDNNGLSEILMNNKTKSEYTRSDASIPLPNSNKDWTIKFSDTTAPSDSSYLFGTLPQKLFKGIGVKESDGYGSDVINYYNVIENLTKTIDLSGLDTSHVSNMSYMFASKYPYRHSSDGSELDYDYTYNNSDYSQNELGNYDEFKIVPMNTNLTSILNANDMDTSHVTNMSNMFANDSSLNTLDMSNLNVQNVTDMSNMFYGDKSLPNWNSVYYNWYFNKAPKTSNALTSDTTSDDNGDGEMHHLPLKMTPSDGLTPPTYLNFTGKHTGKYTFIPQKLTNTIDFYAYGKLISSVPVSGIEYSKYTIPKSFIPKNYVLAPSKNNNSFIFRVANQHQQINLAKYGYDIVEFTYNNRPVYITASPYNSDAMPNGSDGSVDLNRYKYPYGYSYFGYNFNNLYGYVKDSNITSSNIMGSWKGNKVHNCYSLTNSDINFINNMKPSDYHYEDKVVKIPVKANLASNTVNFTLNGKIVASKAWTGLNTSSDLGVTTYMKQLASDAPKYTTSRDGLDDSKYIVTNQGVSAINNAISDADKGFFSSNFQYNNSVLNIPVEPIPKLGVDTINYVDSKTGRVIGRHTFTPANSKEFSDNDIIKFTSDSDYNTFRGYIYDNNDNGVYTSLVLPSDNSLRTAKRAFVLDADIDKDLSNPSNDTYELSPQGIETLRALSHKSGQFHYKNAVVNVEVQPIPKASVIFHYIYNGKVVGEYSINGLKDLSTNGDYTLLTGFEIPNIAGICSVPDGSILKGLSSEYGLSANEYNELGGNNNIYPKYTYDNQVHNINVVPVNSTDTLKYYVGDKSNVIDTEHVTGKSNMDFYLGYNNEENNEFIYLYEVSMPSKLEKNYRLANKKQSYTYDGGTKYIPLLSNYNTDTVHYIALNGNNAGNDVIKPVQMTGRYDKDVNINQGTKVNGYTVAFPATFTYDGQNHDVFVVGNDSVNKTINLNLVYKANGKVVKSTKKQIPLTIPNGDTVTGNYSDRDNDNTDYVSDLDPEKYDSDNYSDTNTPISFNSNSRNNSFTYTYDAQPASSLEIIYYDIHEITDSNPVTYENHPIINTVLITTRQMSRMLTAKNGFYTPAIVGQQINLNDIINKNLPEGYHISDQSNKPLTYTMAQSKNHQPIKLTLGMTMPNRVQLIASEESAKIADHNSLIASSRKSFLASQSASSVAQSYADSADKSIASSYQNSINNSVARLNKSIANSTASIADKSIASSYSNSVNTSVKDANNTLASNDANSADNSITNSYQNSVANSVNAFNQNIAQSLAKSADTSIAESYKNSAKASIANLDNSITNSYANSANKSISNSEKASVAKSVMTNNQKLAQSAQQSANSSIASYYKNSVADSVNNANQSLATSYKNSVSASVSNMNSSLANSYKNSADTSIANSYSNSVKASVKNMDNSIATSYANSANTSINNSEHTSVANSVSAMNSQLASHNASVTNQSIANSESESVAISNEAKSTSSASFNNETNESKPVSIKSIHEYIPSDNGIDKLVAELEAKPVINDTDIDNNNHIAFKVEQHIATKPMKHVARLHDIKVGHIARYYGMSIKHLRIRKGMKLNKHVHIYISIKLRRLASHVSLRHYHIKGAYEIIGKHGKYVRLQIKIGHHIYYVSGKALHHTNHR